MKPINLFIHGALSTRRSFSFIKSQLLLEEQVANPQAFAASSPADFKAQCAYEYKDFSYDIRAEKGADMVDRLYKQLKTYGNRPVTMICHSFGGVLGVSGARRILTEKDDLNISVVTMGSPLGGSAMASFLKMLKPSSTFFRNIGSYDSFMKEFMSEPLPCRTRALITTEGHADWMNEPNDGVVTVGSQMYYEGDPYFYPATVKTNHFEVLLSDKAVGYIKKELHVTH